MVGALVSKNRLFKENFKTTIYLIYETPKVRIISTLVQDYIYFNSENINEKALESLTECNNKMVRKFFLINVWKKLVNYGM